MIGWEAPGPYRVAFTTREGGVSGGPYRSLNLGARGDDPRAIDENRRLACAELGLDPGALALNRQQHSTIVTRARPGLRGVGDGLFSDEPGLPLLALAADCVPVAIVSTVGPPALAVVHAGWRGLAAGILAAAVAALAATETAAIVGPAIGPCCYEVGPEVVGALRPRADAGGQARPLGGGGEAARCRRRCPRRPGRALHPLPPGALLLTSAQRPGRLRAAGGDRCSRVLRSRGATGVSATRSGRA